jgi:hypothetical protein
MGKRVKGRVMSTRSDSSFSFSSFASTSSFFFKKAQSNSFLHLPKNSPASFLSSFCREPMDLEAREKRPWDPKYLEWTDSSSSELCAPSICFSPSFKEEERAEESKTAFIIHLSFFGS